MRRVDTLLAIVNRLHAPCHSGSLKSVESFCRYGASLSALGG